MVQNATALLPVHETAAALLPAHELPSEQPLAVRVSLSMFIRLVRPILVRPHPRRCRTWAFILALLLMLAVETTLPIIFSYKMKDFTDELTTQGDPSRFWSALLSLAASQTIAGLAAVANQFLHNRFILFFRLMMTEHILVIYFAHNAFLALEAGSVVDNPDERIVNDIQHFISPLVFQGLTLLQLLATSTAFFAIVWELSPELFATEIVVCAAGTILAAMVGYPRLKRLTFEATRSQASLRFTLARVRLGSSVPATGHKQARADIQEFTQLATRKLGVLASMWAVQHLLSSTHYWLPALVLAPRLLSGDATVGDLSQATKAVGDINHTLLFAIKNVEHFAEFASATFRLHTLVVEAERAMIVYSD